MKKIRRETVLGLLLESVIQLFLVWDIVQTFKMSAKSENIKTVHTNLR